jgi:hypothetical protein
MKKPKTYNNSKFPNKTIEIFYDTVYGGGRILQFEESRKNSQSLILAKKALSVFEEELANDGWKAA